MAYKARAARRGWQRRLESIAPAHQSLDAAYYLIRGTSCV
jgi:hypothetical protein